MSHGSVHVIIMSITLIEPWTLNVILHRQNHDLTVKLDHILLQFHKEACAVAPAHPRCAVIVYHNSRIEVIPPASLAVISHGILNQRSSDSINKRTCRAIRNRHTNGLAVRIAALCRDIEIVLAIRTLNYLRSPRLTYRPCKIGRFHDHAMISPCLHIFCRIADPLSDIKAVFAFISRSILEAFIMAADKVQSAVRSHHWGRICSILIPYERIAFIFKGILRSAANEAQTSNDHCRKSFHSLSESYPINFYLSSGNKLDFKVLHSLYLERHR